MMWDGLGFFGFDHPKLGRLGSEPVRWFTKFKSVYFTVSLIISATVIFYVVIMEASKLNTIKTQTTTLIPV